MTRRAVGVTSERAAQGPTRAAEGAAPTDAGEVVDSPAMWDAHVARCLDGLSGHARRLVEVGAVIGSSFTIADAAEVLGQPAGSLMAALEEAVDTGALVLTPASLEFRHERIRRVAYDAVPSALASELALRALALTDAGDVDRFARTATVVENLVAAGRLEEADYLARRALGSHGGPAPVAAGGGSARRRLFGRRLATVARERATAGRGEVGGGAEWPSPGARAVRHHLRRRGRGCASPTRRSDRGRLARADGAGG
jgi:hypothetical protein